MDKFYVRVAARDRPIRLGWIVELTHDGETGVMTAGDKMALVSRNTYRTSHIMPLGMQRGEHVRIVAQTAASCTLLRFPGDRSLPLAALADAVEKAVA